MTPTPCRETIGYVDAEPETPAADRLHRIGFDDAWVAIDGYVARSWITDWSTGCALNLPRSGDTASRKRQAWKGSLPTGAFATPIK